jgi:hypothetical protein
MEVIQFSEKSINFYQTLRRQYSLEDSTYHKQVEETSMEKWAKASVREARPSMNFSRRLLVVFWNIRLYDTKEKQIRTLSKHFHKTKALNVGVALPLRPLEKGRL